MDKATLNIEEDIVETTLGTTLTHARVFRSEAGIYLNQLLHKLHMRALT